MRLSSLLWPLGNQHLCVGPRTHSASTARASCDWQAVQELTRAAWSTLFPGLCAAWSAGRQRQLPARRPPCWQLACRHLQGGAHHRLLLPPSRPRIGPVCSLAWLSCPPAAELHGNLTQAQRLEALDSFRQVRPALVALHSPSQHVLAQAHIVKLHQRAKAASVPGGLQQGQAAPSGKLFPASDWEAAVQLSCFAAAQLHLASAG